jgi:hypothetical protein
MYELYSVFVGQEVEARPPIHPSIYPPLSPDAYRRVDVPSRMISPSNLLALIRRQAIE